MQVFHVTVTSEADRGCSNLRDTYSRVGVFAQDALIDRHYSKHEHHNVQHFPLRQEVDC